MDKYFQICKNVGTESWWYYKGDIYRHSRFLEKEETKKQAMRISIVVVISFLIVSAVSVLLYVMYEVNPVFHAYIDGQKWIHATLTVLGACLFFITRSQMAKFYINKYILASRKASEIEMPTEVNWKEELQTTYKLYSGLIVFLLVWIVGGFVNLIKLHSIAADLVFVYLSILMGALIGHHSFSQRIKFQRQKSWRLNDDEKDRLR